MESYVLFWGGEFSNFYAAPFVIEGVTYTCNEQYFMKKKQELFDSSNDDLAKKIMTETSPKKIKAYGRKVQNYDEEIWGRHRYDVMKTGLFAKFSQNEALKHKLIETGNKTICEASPFDKIWGIGLGITVATRLGPERWKGQNLLGKALMEVRTALQSSPLNPAPPV